MTIAVDMGRKATKTNKQTNQKSRELVETIDTPQIDGCLIWAAS